ncbi:Bgt-20463 [Blumeria graminis f. sp. tritici]|uniref:Bgt-20463 n=2 Tax=Blumeria graminis f. sp. tritici TaxID=62690 RepID=A0A381LAZ5_BLUGR|nr:Bgt-20463 [Blumeria graminis f. sp. tritici]
MNHYVFGFSPDVGIRRAPHPVVFCNSSRLPNTCKWPSFRWLERGDNEELRAPLSV